MKSSGGMAGAILPLLSVKTVYCLNGWEGQKHGISLLPTDWPKTIWKIAISPASCHLMFFLLPPQILSLPHRFLLPPLGTCILPPSSVAAFQTSSNPGNPLNLHCPPYTIPGSCLITSSPILFKGDWPAYLIKITHHDKGNGHDGSFQTKYFFKFFKKLNRSIVDLQGCDNFCCTTK